MTTMTTGLQLHGITVRYGKRQVLHDLSVGPLPRGELTALVGPNGSGKSTLLRTLAGLCRPVAGTATLDGAPLPLDVGSARSHSVVYLPQSLPEGVRMSALESILVAGRAGQMHGMARHDVTLAHARAVLHRLNIDFLADRTLDEMSGGQRQLVGIAQALIRAPQVLLLDEPLSALDLNHQFQVMQALRDIAREHGIVVVVVLHDINAALRWCERIALLHAGAIAHFGPATHTVTPARLATVFGVRARVEPCSQGIHQIVIDGMVA